MPKWNSFLSRGGPLSSILLLLFSFLGSWVRRRLFANGRRFFCRQPTSIKTSPNDDVNVNRSADGTFSWIKSQHGPFITFDIFSKIHSVVRRSIALAMLRQMFIESVSIRSSVWPLVAGNHQRWRSDWTIFVRWRSKALSDCLVLKIENVERFKSYRTGTSSI